MESRRRIIRQNPNLTATETSILLYIEELTQDMPKGSMVSVSISEMERDTKLHKETLLRVIGVLAQKGFLTREKKPGTTARYTVSLSHVIGQTSMEMPTGTDLPTRQIPTSTEMPTGDVELQPLVSDDAPEYYHILSSMEGFAGSLEMCEWWRERRGFTEEQIEDAAQEMKSKLSFNGTGQWVYVDREGRKRYYTDLWSTCQGWTRRGEKSQSRYPTQR